MTGEEDCFDVPFAHDDSEDLDLIEAARAGTRLAFGQLYQRYAPHAYGFAYQLTDSMEEADDLVSEAFAEVLERVVSGGGPGRRFLPYLLTTVYTTWCKQFVYEHTVRGHLDRSDFRPPAVDPAALADQIDLEFLRRAFASLPRRWQSVLWHLDVENAAPRAVAELTGIHANAIEVLAFRARDGLRVAYAQMHVSAPTEQACEEASPNLAAWLCGRLRDRVRTRIALHVRGCRRCTNAAREVSELLARIHRLVPLAVNQRVVVVPESRSVPSRRVTRAVIGECRTSRPADTAGLPRDRNPGQKIGQPDKSGKERSCRTEFVPAFTDERSSDRR